MRSAFATLTNRVPSERAALPEGWEFDEQVPAPGAGPVGAFIGFRV